MFYTIDRAMSWLLRNPMFIFLGMAGILALALYAAGLDENRWVDFSRAHHCKVVAKTEGNFGTGLGTNGKLTTIYINGTTTYRCDDGIDYTR